jgi:hypothetical protein
VAGDVGGEVPDAGGSGAGGRIPGGRVVPEGADLPADEAAEGYDLIDQLAQMLKADGDARPIGQLRAEVFSRLIRRPPDSGLPAVTANVTVTAALAALEGTADPPGSVVGMPITAGHGRDLLRRLQLGLVGGLHRPAGLHPLQLGGLLRPGSAPTGNRALLGGRSSSRPTSAPSKGVRSEPADVMTRTYVRGTTVSGS